jgi:DNA polymerase alpha-associated DNA helicase A
MIARFVSTTTALVQKELDAEQAAVASLIAPLLKGNATSAHGSSWTALQRNGTALLNLAVTAMRSGLAGKTLVDFEPSASTATSELPPHRFRVGDVVALVSHAARRDGKKGHAETSSSADSINGVICRIKPALITVVISSDSARGDESLLFSGSDANDRWRVVQLGNEITYKRMMEAMSALEQIASEAANVPSQGINSTPKLPIIPSHHSELRDLIPVLIGTSPSAPVFEADSNNIPQFFTSDLNESQKDAIQFALSARHVALIHGPPGTGKSHTLVELIRQLVESKHERVLVCGPSNTAVDTLAERLSHCGLNMARVGHPARVKTALLDHCLEVRVRTSDEGQLVNDVRNDVDRTLAQISKCKKRSERKILYGELKLLRKEVNDYPGLSFLLKFLTLD